jgi:23S rRNA (guanosine2251-2'-O)-methyltransferase
MRVVCGIQPVREVIRARAASLDRVLVESAKDSPQLEALARFARDQGARVERVSRAQLDRLAKGGRHQGALAMAPDLRIVPLSEIDLGKGALVVALDELEDPQNFGAIVRSSVAMGATAIVWPEHHSAPLTPATFRASAGAVEHATLCRVGSLPEALMTLRSAGLSVVGLDMAAETAIDSVPLVDPVALVVGAEGKGLRRPVKAACSALARLPMAGPLSSLNASAAAAVALYETLRQRGVSRKGPRGQ